MGYRRPSPALLGLLSMGAMMHTYYPNGAVPTDTTPWDTPKPVRTDPEYVKTPVDLERLAKAQAKRDRKSKKA
jgi:hypothetical protein